ncbi:hypothetical protein ASG57_18835 [Bradyrhizobium sp. Leaf396]|jgi:hypothetical protein|nr:hypothetical protein ASG57_18835 [Bradyrhizobium sp. Leaf396]
MKGIVVAALLLGMVNTLQAKEADYPRGEVRSLAKPARQLATSSDATSAGNAENSRPNRRRGGELSPGRIVPDICTGC